MQLALAVSLRHSPEVRAVKYALRELGAVVWLKNARAVLVGDI